MGGSSCSAPERGWSVAGASRGRTVRSTNLRATLEAVASLEVPPLAMRVAGLALAAIAVILALGALPRRSPYRAERMFAGPSAQGGFVGRVRFFAEHPSNLFPPLMVYKLELEAEILRRLALPEQTRLREVLAGMRARGLGEEDVDAMRALMVELDELHEAGSAPRVSARRFRQIVETGEKLLGRLGEMRAA